METFRDVRNREFSSHLNRLLSRAQLSPSDVCRAIWGEHVTSKGYKEAKGLQNFSNYMRGKGYPNETNRKKIAAALGITVEQLENPRSTVTPSLRSNRYAPVEIGAGEIDTSETPAAVPEAPDAPKPRRAPEPPAKPRDPPGSRAYEHVQITPEPGLPGLHRLRFDAVVTAEAIATFMLAISDMEKVSRQTGGLNA